MKKTIIVTMLAVVGYAGSALGQGFIFQSTKANGVYFTPQQNGTASPSLGNGSIDVGFLWALTGASAPLLGTSGISTSSTTVPESASWNNILNDPNFHLAQNGGSTVVATVNNSGVAQAGWNYNGGAAFIPTGTTAGSVYEIIAIAWSSAYATPQLAAAAGSFLGYSSLFNYTSSASSSTAPPTFAAAGMTAFGVVNPVPEPGTMALAGLGIASLLALRRKK